MDFADDALTAGRTITPTHVDAMMAELKRLGIRRVSWGWYGDGMGGMHMPGGYSDTSLSGWQHYADTFRALGGNPLKGAVTVEPAPCDFRDHFRGHISTFNNLVDQSFCFLPFFSHGSTFMN